MKYTHNNLEKLHNWHIDVHTNNHQQDTYLWNIGKQTYSIRNLPKHLVRSDISQTYSNATYHFSCVIKDSNMTNVIILFPKERDKNRNSNTRRLTNSSLYSQFKCNKYLKSASLFFTVLLRRCSLGWYSCWCCLQHQGQSWETSLITSTAWISLSTVIWPAAGCQDSSVLSK